MGLFRSKSEKLLKAVEKGNLKKCKKLIEKKMDNKTINDALVKAKNLLHSTESQSGTIDNEYDEALKKNLGDAALRSSFASMKLSLKIHNYNSIIKLLKDFCFAEMEKFTDQTILAEIVNNNEDRDLRMAAVGKISDPVILADMAKNCKDWVGRKAFVEKLSDQDLLADIAKNDGDNEVRSASEKRLQELKKK